VKLASIAAACAVVELAAEIVIVSVADPVPAELVAEIDPEVVAIVVGVPVICPFDVLTNRPPGNPVALKLVGEFVAMI
jgi:4-hydroxy-3-methylbut-2-en-1-yl diphosphate synthase IspG/GcpE